MKISWFPEQLIDTGFLGLTHSPGARRNGRDEDLAFLAGEGVHRIVCLQESCELNDYVQGGSLQNRIIAVERLGMDFTHFPIPDFDTPPQLDAAMELVRDIQHDLDRGRRIVMHCFAGLGRAGTIAASILVARGWPADEAVDLVRSVRPGAIQTDKQQQFVSEFAAAYAALKKS